jgi:MerR family mercuric resistance operon transcriptional regulator
LQFLHRAKVVGFTLNEIKELLSLRVDPDTSCDDVKARTEQKITDIDEKIRTLQRMKHARCGLTPECDVQSCDTECSMLVAVDGALPRKNKELKA